MVISEKFLVGFKQTNEKFEMTNSAMLSFFVEVAGLHSAKCGERIETSPNRWLLLGYKMRILKRPKLQTYINVLTWSSEVKGITALREFEIRDESGELMVSCLSNWVNVNISTRKMERLTDEKMKVYESEPERTNFENKSFEKMPIPESFDEKKEFVADWKLMDINQHMNNANYLEVAQEFASKDFKTMVENFDFDINYKKEILCGQVVLCCYKKTEEGCFVFFVNKETGEIHSTIRFFK